ncbi:MAG: serpin family protein [Prevotella sp.]|nr:serpin family protein [Prevotella sp.]
MRTMTLLTVVLIVLNISAADLRPMLAEGKTWWYTYHHFEDVDNGAPQEFLSQVGYMLRGDTVIDGRHYMKMYRHDDGSFSYYGAFREDEEGRVWQYDYLGDKKDFLLFDVSLHFGDNSFPEATPIEETIQVNRQLFRRFRYQNVRPDGSLYTLGFVAVEGVGFQGKGLVHWLFEPEPDCICDYESFEYVSGDYYFSVTDFNAPKYIELTQDEQRLVKQNNDFAFHLMSEVSRGQNLILSPLSITYALGMLNNGAAGQTQQEISTVLGGADVGSPEAINLFCRKMMTESGLLDPTTKVSIANTIYVNEPYQLKPSFVEKANTYYDAQPERRDFHDGQTVDVINQWASDHTQKMIEKVLDEETFNPDNVSYLLNAIYFKGAWQNKFDEKNTKEEVFDHAGYTKELTTMPMMSQAEEFAYAEDDDYQAIRLPYGNGAYSMTVLLPKLTGSKIVNTVPQVPTAAQFGQLCRNMRSTMVYLKLPRFETKTDMFLNDVMSALGMPTAFTLRAEFPEFCNVETYIGLMKQVARIKLDEQGTEAAAVTVIAQSTGMPHYAEFHATRPFLYVISEQSTGAIFFVGAFTCHNGPVEGGFDGIDQPELGDQPVAADRLYNLDGQRLQAPPAKGLYIENGRVVMRRQTGGRR